MANSVTRSSASDGSSNDTDMATSAPSPNSATSTSIPTLAVQPFRLLDLPMELFLMVLENVDFETRHYRVKDPAAALDSPTGPESFMTLAVEFMPTSILATCRVLNKEVSKIVDAKVEQLRHSKQSYHFIFDFPTWVHFTQGGISDVIDGDQDQPKSPKAGSLIADHLLNIEVGSHTFDHNSAEYLAVWRFIQEYNKRIEDSSDDLRITIRAQDAQPVTWPRDFWWRTFWHAHEDCKVTLELVGFDAGTVQAARDDTHKFISGRLYGAEVIEVPEVEYQRMCGNATVVRLD